MDGVQARDPQTHNYDEADRLIDSGTGNSYTYDAFGRTTQVPAADAGGTTLTSAYDVNDGVQSMTHARVNKSFDYDPAGPIHVPSSTGQSNQVDQRPARRAESLKKWWASSPSLPTATGGRDSPECDP